MRALSTLVLCAALAAPAAAADHVITMTKHTDAGRSMSGQAQEARDSTQTTWIGKDRMRVEDDDNVFIVRADLMKVFILDPRAKTASTLDMPIDIKKHMPAEFAPMFEDMLSRTKVTVEPTTETKKIRGWNATKYVLTMTRPMGPGMEMKIVQTIWATKDTSVDAAAVNDMYGTMMSIMGGPSMAVEMKKIEGLPILIERSQTVMGNETKSRDEVTSVEAKEAPAGAYDVPKDYTVKPFDPLSMMGGGGKGRPVDARGTKPKTPPVPEPKDG